MTGGVRLASAIDTARQHATIENPTPLRQLPPMRRGGGNSSEARGCHPVKEQWRSPPRQGDGGIAIRDVRRDRPEPRGGPVIRDLARPDVPHRVVSCISMNADNHCR